MQKIINLWFSWVSQIHFVQDEQLGPSSEHEFEIGIATREWDMGIGVMEMHQIAFLELRIRNYIAWSVWILLHHELQWHSHRTAIVLRCFLILRFYIQQISLQPPRNIHCNVLFIRGCTFGHVSREPISQWKIRERKLLPESIHNPFHSLHGSWSVGYFLHGNG